MDDLLCGGFALVIILAALVIYRRSFSRGYWDHEHDPIFFDARNDQEDQIIECASIANQRRFGKERGGDIHMIIDREPRDYSAQLALRSLSGKAQIERTNNNDED